MITQDRSIVIAYYPSPAFEGCTILHVYKTLDFDGQKFAVSWLDRNGNVSQTEWCASDTQAIDIYTKRIILDDYTQVALTDYITKAI